MAPLDVVRRRPPVVHSRCVQVHVNDLLAEAVSTLSTKSATGEIPLVIIPYGRQAWSMFLQVPSGVTCLLQRFGKDLGEVEPGLHFMPSYYRIAYAVSQQSCAYDAPVRACPTSDDVWVDIDVVVVFEISDASRFVYRLGAKNFDDFLSGTVDEATRVLVRKEDHRTVYNLRGDRSDEMLTLLNDKFNDMGVRFSDVKVTSVWLPERLEGYLEKTTKMDKKMEKWERQHEFETMQITQESEMNIEEIKRKSEQTVVSEKGRTKRAELEFEQRSVKAEEDGRVSLIVAEGQVAVQILEAKTQLNRTKTELETYRTAALAKAEAAAAAMRVKAELQEEEAIIQASCEEEKMLCEAQATRHEAAAEKEASRCLVAKRQHEMDLREKRILATLAEQGDFNLVGTSGDRLLGAMMSGSFAPSK